MITVADIQALPTALVASKEHGAIAAQLSLNRKKLVPVHIADIQAYLQVNGLWAAIKAIAANPTSPGKLSGDAIIDICASRYITIDMALPVVSNILTALVTAGALTAAQRTALIAMGSVPDVVTNQEVIDTMKGM